MPGSIPRPSRHCSRRSTTATACGRLYFLGRFEDLHGHAKEATDDYRRCEGITETNEADRVLPFQELRKRGIEPKRLPPEDPEKKESDY